MARNGRKMVIYESVLFQNRVYLYKMCIGQFLHSKFFKKKSAVWIFSINFWMPIFENSATFLRLLLAILENDFITLLLAECVIKEEPNLKVHTYMSFSLHRWVQKKSQCQNTDFFIGGHSNFDQFLCVDIMRKR